MRRGRAGRRGRPRGPAPGRARRGGGARGGGQGGLRAGRRQPVPAHGGRGAGRRPHARRRARRSTRASSSRWRPRSARGCAPGVVGSLGEGEALLDGLRDGGSALVAGHAAAAAAAAASPAAGAGRILDHVHPPADLAPVVERLLADAWLVEDLASVPRDFTGIAITPRGRALFGSTGELRQAPRGRRGADPRGARVAGGADRRVGAGGRRGGRRRARRSTQAAALVAERLERREGANAQAREASRALDEADELLRRAARRIELRSGCSRGGPGRRPARAGRGGPRRRAQAGRARCSTSAPSASCGWCGCAPAAPAAASSRPARSARPPRSSSGRRGSRGPARRARRAARGRRGRRAADRRRAACLRARGGRDPGAAQGGERRA